MRKDGGEAGHIRSFFNGHAASAGRRDDDDDDDGGAKLLDIPFPSFLPLSLSFTLAAATKKEEEEFH